VQGCFRLALLDYRMPGMEGLELYRCIQHLQGEMQGILVTAETLAAAKEAGVRHVVPKPFDF